MVVDQDGSAHITAAEHKDIIHGGAANRDASELEPHGDVNGIGISPAGSTADKEGRRPEPVEDERDPAAQTVQFGPSVMIEGGGDSHHRRRSSVGPFDKDSPAKDRRGQSLLTKLKALASTPGPTNHGRSNSVATVTDDPTEDESTPRKLKQKGTNADGERHDEGVYEDGDADAEESGGDESAEHTPTPKPARKTRRKFHLSKDDSQQNAPSTPRIAPNFRPNFLANLSSSPGERARPSLIPRRATMGDLQDHSRQGLSEDEGRQQLKRMTTWRNPSSWGQSPRSWQHMHGRRNAESSSREGRRPVNFRRITGLGDGKGVGAAGAGAGASSLRWGHRGERAQAIGDRKWRPLKAGFRLFGPGRKVENTIDHAKSAELLAELTAGAPAALILASMFRRDDHGHKRVPILLEQLKVKITDTKHLDPRSGDRHLDFRIDLEYGNGLTRMKWSVYRTLREFVGLHTRYKFHTAGQKYIQFKGEENRTKLPHFPRSAFPYLRGMRDLGSEEDEDVETDADLGNASSGEATNTDRKERTKKKARPPMKHRRKSSVITSQDPDAVALRREAYPDRQRKKLEIYLQQMIRYLMFRPDSNRLCQFLELSALGVRLAAEDSYHGKEGFMVIQSGNGLDFRRAWTPGMMAGRHRPKWFCVRHSYIVCIESLEGMHIYDVFLVDSNFRISAKRKRFRDQQKPKDLAKAARDSAAHPQHHTLKLYNSERKMKLLAKNERSLEQFQESILFMATSSGWSKPKRFDSFAPVRSNVFAQWLVDGRDYMWNASRAISMAKDVIYIHDWWLSPELYMRRPAAISQKWRLDRLLQRKAREGVKVFVLMYRNINSAIPIDSGYSKFSLLDLHPNIFVQRSPNQFRQNTFFWAHHEKLCLIDHMVAFIGGIDLCFGRWDTPQHSLIDDKPTGFEPSNEPKDADHCQLWPGKDYSNPRMQDFYALDKPYEEMYNRDKVPRMPWHDIHMQIVGQPARDLTRHFVQRWNYILRQRRPTRPTPFLLPPPDFNPKDLEALGLKGTCEIQVLRSACEWSLGTPGITEHSIMNAYMKMIEESEHLVYIENQFFISSCEVEGTPMENKIGDALVERIIRAARKKEDWRAIIIIPLMPGFQNTVDQQEGTSVRLIMQCQYRSICRGEASIFGRLRAAGIEPEDYVQFYSLRSWGKIGPNKQLVTEQLYIHAKCMIVDDRMAIIGSANINERSLLGDRDSECAAVVRDTDMLQITMNGQPYLVGRFPHTLRMRLMREHLGIDVDEVMDEDQLTAERQGEANEEQGNAEPDDILSDQTAQPMENPMEQAKEDELLMRSEHVSSFNHDADWEQAKNPNLKSFRKLTEDPRVTHNAEHRKSVEGEGHDFMKQQIESDNPNQRDSVLKSTAMGEKEYLVVPDHSDRPQEKPSLEKYTLAPGETDHTSEEMRKSITLPPETSSLPSDVSGQQPQAYKQPLSESDDRDLRLPEPEPENAPKAPSPHEDFVKLSVTKDCMKDPLDDLFYVDVWHAVAEHNTRLFRQVFRCMPDSEVRSWKDYKEYVAYAERFSQSCGVGGSSIKGVLRNPQSGSGPPGAGSAAEKLRSFGSLHRPSRGGDADGLGGKIAQTLSPKEPLKTPSLENVEQWAKEANRAQEERRSELLNEKESHETPLENSLGSLDEKGRGSNDFKPLHTNTSSTINFSAPDPDANKINRHSSVNTQAESFTRGSSVQKRKRRATMRSLRREFRASDDIICKEDAEELMGLVQGHLVLWPYDWLEKEEQGGNWLYSIDGLAPLEIYT